MCACIRASFVLAMRVDCVRGVQNKVWVEFGENRHRAWLVNHAQFIKNIEYAKLLSVLDTLLFPNLAANSVPFPGIALDCKPKVLSQKMGAES